VSLQQNQILHNARHILKQVPYRTTFERENFLFSNQTGPKFLVALCRDIEFLNHEYNKVTTDWEKEAILKEMNIIATKISEVQQEVGENVTQAIEDAEPEFWVEELSRRAAIEALVQKTTHENMSQMLKLPADLYEDAITKCQHFLNIIAKVTRQAERKANLSNVPATSMVDPNESNN
jgi:hypothetical protein